MVASVVTRLRSSATAAALGLVVSVAIVSVAVARITPKSLLVPPERPNALQGNPAVRTEGPDYPRRATGADETKTTVVAAPRRIVSQYWSTDEFLYTIVPPERVVGVADTSYIPSFSNVLEFTERFKPVIAADPERVLRADPDLVFSPETARADLPGVLREAGLPVYRIFTTYESLSQIEDHIRLVGYLTGEDVRASAELERFRTALARAAARRPPGIAPPRVLGMGGSYTYGSRTLFSDIIRVLGAENLGATHGLTFYERVNDERIVRWDPDWIVTGGSGMNADEVRAQLLARPAVAATSAGKNGRIIVLDSRVFLPLSPFTTRLVEALAEALYPHGPAS